MKRLPFGLRLAKLAAEKSNYKIRVGAAILDGNKIFISWNKKKSSPALRYYLYKYETCLHAETGLFPHGKEWSRKAKLYVYRELKNGNPANALPCENCLKMIKSFSIRTLVYTIDEGYVHKDLRDGKKRQVIFT